MPDEFDKLMEYFSYDSNEKEKKLEEIFQESMEFFERFKHVMATGTEEEKDKMRKKMETLAGKLKEENKKGVARTGLTSEEMKQITADPKNFTDEQWELLQKVQGLLAKEKEKQGKAKEKKKKKQTTKRSSWMKS